MLQFERDFWDRGMKRVAGVDEAGRGPLAGPVFAAAVVLIRSFAETEEFGLLEGLTDSKKLSHSRRESFLSVLQDSPHADISVAKADVDEIDALNIRRATHLAMRRAVSDLAVSPEHVLVDGLPVTDFPCPSTAIVGGDSKSLSIAAASVAAKIARDRFMEELDELYPVYGFARHKGYGTSYHIRALFEHGPSPVHRRSFRPVREAAEIRRRTAP